jgi:hypothetical protein
MTTFIKMISLPQKLVTQVRRYITIAGLAFISLNASAYDISINGSEYLGLTETLDGLGAPTTNLMEYDYTVNPSTVSFHVTDPLVCASKANSSSPNIITQVQDGNGIEVTTMQNNIATTQYDYDNNQFNITTDDTIACATIADAANNTVTPPAPDVIFLDGFENSVIVASNDIQLTLLKVTDSNTLPMATEPFPTTPISVSNNEVVEYQYVIANNSQAGSPNLTVDFVEFYSLIASNGPIFDDVQNWTCTVPGGSNVATVCGTASGSETIRLDNAVIAPGDELIIFAQRLALVDATDISNNLKLDMLASAFVVDAAITDSYLDNNTTYQQFGSSLVTATQLVMTGQPNASVASGDSLGSIVVEFQDAGGLIDASNTSAVTIAIQNNPSIGSAGVLSGTVTKSAVNGIATFTDLSIDLVGTGYTLVANGGGFTSPISNALNVIPAAASQLAIITQPADTVAGGTINPVTVELQDLNGNLVNSNAGGVHVSIVPFSGASGALLSGSNDIVMTNGLVTFNDLSIDLVNLINDKYRLRFNYQNFGGNFDSNEFNITAVPVAANSEFGVSVNSETAGTNVTYSALIKDAGNNPVGAGIVVNFVMTNTDANTPSVSCTTSMAGTCNVTTTSTLIGTTVVAADIGGTNIPNTTVGLFNSTIWVAGLADAAMSNFWFDTATTPMASTVNVIAEVKDQYGNFVSGIPVTFSLLDASGAVTPDFPSCSTTTNSVGTCSAAVTSATTGTTTVTSAAAGFPSVIITNPTPPMGFGRVVTWQ